MRFMILLKATAASERGDMPDEAPLEEMAKYNEQLAKAGVLLDGAGLQPSRTGARVRCSGGQRSVVDGPFAETKELVAGYWVLQVKSRAEAIEWVKRCPDPMPDGEAEIEIRQLWELDDFPQGPAVDHHRRVAELTDKS